MQFSEIGQLYKSFFVLHKLGVTLAKYIENLGLNKIHMKRKIIIFTFLVVTLNIFSQNNSGNELTAEGNAKTKVKPDLASFRVTIEKRNLIEKNSIKELNEEIEKLQKLLLQLGFTDKNIKISEFIVSSNQDNNEKKEYHTSNTLIVTFNLDNTLIETFYQEVQNENLMDADIEFETQVSEELEKATRQKLIKKAIDDAISNAENIANALEVKLVNIKQVTKYGMRNNIEAASYKNIDMVKFSKPIKAMSNQKTSFDKFEVEEKELEESITIIYEITKK